ncbi:hypothetical protein [Thermomonospora umbrina]|uniref:Uncharacterized protein n=1 Tax=Thermomonospora umbrina TaxID=111806 RepID=A0A3D9SWX2_9ACTN|nr:hypothetical protein [Thermomonospora umbrina]REE99010.1 hypothetical protein DFJ69_4513 [Thermomonospora umbrina]
MSEDRQQKTADRWRALPDRTPLEDLVAVQEVPPKPQVVGEPGNTALEEATRYPA